MGPVFRAQAVFIVLSLLTSISALAQPALPIALFPPGPTSATPIELFVPIVCPVGDHTVERTDSLIRIHIGGANTSCPTPPIAYGHPIDLPPLPSGEYRVEVTYLDSSRLYASTTFIVRDAAKQPFEVHPSAVPAESEVPLRVRIVPPIDEFFCVSPAGCSAIVLRVGGVEVTDKMSDDFGGLWFISPKRDPGLADLSIQIGDKVMVSRDALYYFDRGAPPETSVFERVLFPVLFASRGTQGSEWVSEAVISNPNLWWVETPNQIQPVACITYPCAGRIAPHRYDRFSGVNYPRGAVLYVPRREAPLLSFALRVRDVSHEAGGYGAAVPVVREKDMSRGPLSLLNVPVDPRFRVKLRMYALDPFPNQNYNEHERTVVTVTVAEAGTDRRTDRTSLLGRMCDYRNCPQLPQYGELDLSPGSKGDLVDIYVTPWTDGEHPNGSLLWAMVTVTNNETQQVTVITPDGSGGVPLVFPFPLPTDARHRP